MANGQDNPFADKDYWFGEPSGDNPFAGKDYGFEAVEEDTAELSPRQPEQSSPSFFDRAMDVAGDVAGAVGDAAGAAADFFGGEVEPTRSSPFTVTPQQLEEARAESDLERRKEAFAGGSPQIRRRMLEGASDEEELAFREGDVEAQRDLESLAEGEGAFEREAGSIGKGALRALTGGATEFGAGTLRFINKPLAPVRGLAEIAALNPLWDVPVEELRVAEEEISVENLLGAVGAPEPKALEESADWLIEQHKRTSEIVGAPETTAGVFTEGAGRLAINALEFLAGGSGARKAAQKISRGAASAYAEGRALPPALARMAEAFSGETRGARVLEDLVVGAPIDYTISASAPENSLASFAAQATEYEPVREFLEGQGMDPDRVRQEFEKIAADPALRGSLDASFGGLVALPIAAALPPQAIKEIGQQQAARRMTDLSDRVSIQPPRRADELPTELKRIPSRTDTRQQEMRRIFRARRGERQRLVRETLAQLSRGEVELEDLPPKLQREVSAGRGSLESLKKNLHRLPDELYHVTTAREAVQREGLKSRRQLGQDRGKGLGGGPDITVSFTSDRDLAETIAETMEEAHRVATGELTVRDLFRMAREGEGADEPFAGSVFNQIDPEWDGGQPTVRLRRFLEEGILERDAGVSFRTQAEAREYFDNPNVTPATSPIGERDGEKLYLRWLVPLEGEELRDRRFELYKRFLAFREEAGGPTNPLFFNSDVEGLAQLDPDDIGVVRARPANPNAKGLQMRAMDEWRTFTGDAVEVEATRGLDEDEFSRVQPEGVDTRAGELEGDQPTRRAEQLSGRVEPDEPVPAVDGDIRRIKFADGTELPAEYSVVEASDLRVSHDPESFRPNRDYPDGVQERRYHDDPGAQENVIRISRQLDPDIVLDPTRRPTDGPPIVTPDGIAVSGNARGMALKRAYQQHPERAAAYRHLLEKRAPEFGLEPDQIARMDQPVLVRKAIGRDVDLASREELAELAAKANDVSTKTREPLAEAATRARRMVANEDALGFYSRTLDSNQTLRSYLRTADGEQFVRRLIDEGTIRSEEASKFLDSKGAVTDEAKTAIERMLYASVIDDPEVISRAPKSALRKLEHAVPPMLQAAQVDGWDLGPVVRESLDMLHSFRRSDFKDFDEFLRQQDMFAGHGPQTRQMARFIEGHNPTTVKRAFRKYAEDARAAQREEEQATLAIADELPGPSESFRQRFVEVELEPDLFRGAEGTPRRSSSAPEAGGARSTDEIGMEPSRTQPSEGLNVSTKAEPPSATTRLMPPATLEGPDSSSLVGSLIKDDSGEWTILQPIADVDEILRRAREAEDSYLSTIQRAANGVEGIEVFGARTKEKERVLEKLSEGRPAEANGDYLGGRVWFDEIENAEEFIAAMAEEGWRLVESDPFLSNPKLGYRAWHLQVVDPESSVVAELQVVPREIGEVQEELHELYEIVRKPETPAPVVRRLSKKVRRGFGEQWEKYLERTGQSTEEVAERMAPHREASERLIDRFMTLGPDESGRASLETATALARSGASFVVGSTVGGLFGDTPEEQLRNALIGGAVGAGVPSLVRALRSVGRPGSMENPAAVQDALGKIVRGRGEDEALDGGLREAQLEAYRKIFDTDLPIEQFTREVEDRLLHDLPATKDAELMADLARGWSSHAALVYERGVIRPGTNDPMSPALKQVLNSVGPAMDDFRVYGLARRVVEDLEPRGIETPISPEQARNILDHYQGREDLERAFEAVQEISDAWMRVLEREGVLTRGAAERIRGENPNYMPMERHLESDEAGEAAGRSGRFMEVPDPIKGIVGNKELPFRDPVVQLIEQQHRFSNLLWRKYVEDALANLAEAWPDNPFMNRIPRPTKQIRFAKDQLKGQIPDFMLDDVEDEFLEAWIPRKISQSEPIVRVREADGGVAYYKIDDERLVEAVMGLDRKQLSLWVKFMSGPPRWLRTGVTIMPEFQLANLMRDIPISAVTSKTKGRELESLPPVIREIAEGGTALGDAATDAVRGLVTMIADAVGVEKAQEIVGLWRSTGAPFAAFQSMDVDVLAREIETIEKQGDVLWNVMHPIMALRRIGDRVRGLTIAIENAPRLGEFMRAVDDPTDRNRVLWAGRESKDITVNFSRHGSATGAIRPLAGFWNARVQGIDKLRRAIRENPKKALGTITASVTLPSLALYAINRDDPAYWQTPVWERNFYWLIPMPGDPNEVPSFLKEEGEAGESLLEELATPVVQRGDRWWIRVMKPHELGWVFGSIPERLLEAIDPNNPYASKGVMDAVGNIGEELGQMFQSFLPIPTAVMPWLENWMNYDMFLGRPVVPYYEEPSGKAAALKGRRGASEIAKHVADLIDAAPGPVELSPAEIDNVLEGYFGTAGRAASDLVDRLVKAHDEEGGPPAAKRRVDRMLVGRFLRDDSDLSAKSITEFYELKRTADGARQTVRGWLEEEEKRRAASAFKSNIEPLLKRDVLNDVADKLTMYREIRNAVRESPKLDAEEKRAMLEQIADASALVASIATFEPEARKRLLERIQPTEQMRAWAEALERAEAAADSLQVKLEASRGGGVPERLERAAGGNR